MCALPYRHTDWRAKLKAYTHTEPNQDRFSSMTAGIFQCFSVHLDTPHFDWVMQLIKVHNIQIPPLCASFEKFWNVASKFTKGNRALLTRAVYS